MNSNSSDEINSNQIKLKELIIKTEGIQLIVEQIHEARWATSCFPKKGELANDYSPEIDENLFIIADGICAIYGLDSTIWRSELKFSKIVFSKSDSNSYEISGTIKAKHPLLNQSISFKFPRITNSVLLDENIHPYLLKLVSCCIDFYNGKKKYIQTELF